MGDEITAQITLTRAHTKSTNQELWEFGNEWWLVCSMEKGERGAVTRKGCDLVLELSSAGRWCQLVEMRETADEMTWMNKGMEGTGKYKAHSENNEPSGYTGAGALYRDFEVRNLCILQHTIGELKSFPKQVCCRYLICVLERIFCELSRKHRRGRWVMAGVSLRWLGQWSFWEVIVVATEKEELYP